MNHIFIIVICQASGWKFCFFGENGLTAVIIPLTLNLMSHRIQRSWSAMALIILLLGAAWTWVSAAPEGATSSGIPAPKEGFYAPDFNLASLSGDSYTLSELRGRPVLINFWASWCPPCKAEMPAIERLYQAKQDQGFIVLAVNTTYQDNLSDIAQFTQDYNLTFPVLLDHDGQTARQYQIRALPTSFFVDSQGKIQAVIVGGPMSSALLQSQLEQVLQGVP